MNGIGQVWAPMWNFKGASHEVNNYVAKIFKRYMYSELASHQWEHPQHIFCPTNLTMYRYIVALL